MYEDRYAVTSAGCWEWHKPDTQRYGRLRHEGTSRLAHRVMYELSRGPIGDTLELDHLCRNTACVNPEHLEPVSHAVNVRRGMSPRIIAWRSETCQLGHTDGYRNRNGKWVCRPCRNRRKADAKSGR